MSQTSVRSQLRLFAVIASLIFGPLLLLGPVVIAICLFLFAAPNISIPAGLALIAASIFVGYHLLQNFHWVEFTGDRIRGAKLVTRQLVEEPIAELESIMTLHGYKSPIPSSDVLLEDGDTGPIMCKGLEFRFKSGKKIGIAVLDMTNIDALIAAVVARHRQLNPPNQSQS
jgi:hypothetical protein